MQKLSEYNDHFAALMRPRKEMAGVACDECGTEMEYVGRETLTTDPPMRRVRCPDCHATGMKMGG